MSKPSDMTQPFARILDVTEDEYFADPCDVPSLSQSIAHTFVTESPLHAWTDHPKLGKQANQNLDGEADTTALIAGKAVHKLLLGKGANIEIIHAANFRTKAAQEARDYAIAEGRVPMLAHKYQEIEDAAGAILGNLEQYGIKFDGESEVAFEWHESGEHGPVVCRGRMDHVFVDRGVIYDVKKIRSAHPKTVSRHISEYGYDIQHAAYTSALASYRPEMLGKIDMVFLFVEVEPPFAVLPVRLDGMTREVGHQRWSRAVFGWERCLRTNKWPTYSDRIVSVEAPRWFITEEMGDQRADW